MVAVIVRKMYAIIWKMAWTWWPSLGDRKNATARGARPDLPAQISAGGVPVWSFASAVADGTRQKAKARTTRRREAERCFLTCSRVELCSNSSTERYIYPPGNTDHYI